jgi:hypothetical protein
MSVFAARAPSCAAVDTGYSLLGRKNVRAELRRLKYLAVGRYVPFAGLHDPSQITRAELDEILADGLASWWIMRVRLPFWKPREHNPEADAIAAVNAAKGAGYAPGTVGYIDAEGMSVDTTSAEAHTYNSRAAHVIVSEGFQGGLYDGFSEPESPIELYETHEVTTYWSDAAHRVIPVRGVAVQQLPQLNILGFPFDPNLVRPDREGETPMWTFPAPPAPAA